jgi:hypothetical protein
VLASIDLTKASDYIHFTQNNKGRKNDWRPLMALFWIICIFIKKKAEYTKEESPSNGCNMQPNTSTNVALYPKVWTALMFEIQYLTSSEFTCL